VSANNLNKNFRTSDMFIEKGDFLRLKNITLGYKIPKKVLDPLHLTQARFMCRAKTYSPLRNTRVSIPNWVMRTEPAQGQYTQQNVDYAQYPLSRTFTVGATITF